MKWIPPQPSNASRNVPMRSQGSVSTWSVDRGENRVKVAESSLEQDVFNILRADRRVLRIHDQPPAVRYVTPDGQEHSHTFDYLTELVNGTRTAFAVKLDRSLVSSGIEGTLALIREQSLRGFADRAVLITDTTATRNRAHNAREILKARAMRNAADVRAMAEVVACLNGDVRLCHLVDAAGLGGRGRNAVVCLIDEGVLALVPDEEERTPRIGDWALLRQTAAARRAA